MAGCKETARALRPGISSVKASLQPNRDGLQLQPTSHGLQLTSDGLQPNSNGLQPTSDGLNLILNMVWGLYSGDTYLNRLSYRRVLQATVAPIEKDLLEWLFCA